MSDLPRFTLRPQDFKPLTPGEIQRIYCADHDSAAMRRFAMSKEVVAKAINELVEKESRR